MKKLLLIVFMCLFAVSAYAKQGESYESYLDWIMTKADCNEVKQLQGYFSDIMGEKAVKQCKAEVEILKAIKADNVEAFKTAIKASNSEGVNERSIPFLILKGTEQVQLFPIHIAIIMNSNNIFNYLIGFNFKDAFDDSDILAENSSALFRVDDYTFNGIDIKGDDFSAISLTIIYNRINMMKTLTKHVIALFRNDGEYNMDYLAHYGTPEMYDILITAADKNDERRDDNQEILCNAAKANNTKLIDYLLNSKKANLKPNSAGYTAVACAAEGNNVELVEKFISMGAKLTEYDVYEIQKLKAVGKWNKEIPKASN